MSNVARRRMKVSLCRAMIVGAVSLVLIAVSFHGGVDEFAQEQVAETTNESIAIYVVSRAINALVSMLQTSQANVLLVSVQVGQMLDPVNDAVERLSSIVVWAVGSLFVQRILLEVAASPVFKWILCSIGVVTIAALWLAEWGRVRMWCCQVFGVSDQDHFFVVIECQRPVRVCLPRGRRQLHEAQLGTQTRNVPQNGRLNTLPSPPYRTTE